MVDTFENTEQELNTTTNTTRNTADIQNVRWARILETPVARSTRSATRAGQGIQDATSKVTSNEKQTRALAKLGGTFYSPADNILEEAKEQEKHFGKRAKRKWKWK